MNLSTMKKDELELLSYTDLTELILKEEKGSMNTANIFKRISSLLGLTDEEYAAKIGDFYTSLTTDKRFLFLDESAEWDLRSRHQAQVVVADDEDEDEDEESEEEVLEEDSEESEEDENIDTMDSDEDDLDDGDDDIGDLAILTEEELEEN